jgi:5,10-methylenetetrahydromethanopterin reductase
MRIGLPLDMSKTAPALVEQAQGIVDRGFAAGVASQIFGPDTLTMLAVIGAQVPDLELVTSVVPTWPRHPVMLAAQALTVSAITGGRLTLGIGLSHQIVVENVFGTPFVRPAQHMEDYLAVLNPLLRGEQVSYKGETLSATTFGPLEVTGPTPPVLVAALAPRMLALAGREADGTATWMTGPATLESHIIPSIRRAAEDAGRPAPRIAAGLPMAVTADPDAARQRAAKAFSVYGTLPSYQAMLAKEGAGGPADVAIVGDESAVADQVRHLAAIGVTDLHAAPFGPADEVKATVDLLASLLSEVSGPS